MTKASRGMRSWSRRSGSLVALAKDSTLNPLKTRVHLRTTDARRKIEFRHRVGGADEVRGELAA